MGGAFINFTEGIRLQIYSEITWYTNSVDLSKMRLQIKLREITW